MGEGTGYPVPAGPSEVETEVRKSRFIARVVPVTNREQALEAVERARREHPEARHHCWAYVLGCPGAATSAAMNDDGEPSGTAGRPILNVIEHKGVGDLVVVVIRYFGGVKLGAGGLVRAYAGAAEAVLSRTPVERHEPTHSLTIEAGFAHEQLLRHQLTQLMGAVDQIHYGEGITATVTLPEKAVDEFCSFCHANGMRISQASPL